MGSLQNFINQMDWWGIVALIISAVAALLCIAFHELSHGYVAYRLGDPTAKNMGRLTLNPLKHIDLVGLVMMVVVRVGWAKPVPVDMRYFRHPKRDMAITALAGPASNFLMAFASLLICSLIYNFVPISSSTPAFSRTALLTLCFFANVAQLSVGLGLFNLFPISPLDGSKILFALLPDKVYYTILRYEKYIMGFVILLVFLGVFSPVLTFLITHVLYALCTVTGFPLGALITCLDVGRLLRAF